MIPKKSSSLFQTLAEDLNLETKLVESFVEFYYKNLRQSMSDLNSTRLNVEGLGHFYVKPGKVKKAIASYNKYIEKYNDTTFKSYHNKKRIEKKLSLLNNIQDKIVLDFDKKKNLKLKNMNLKQIWKERHKIMEGIKNSIIRDEFIEDVAKLRKEVCDDCTSKGDECAVVGTAPCCNECGCSLTFKTRSLSSDCPLGKWKAVCTEDEEDDLDNLKE